MPVSFLFVFSKRGNFPFLFEISKTGTFQMKKYIHGENWK